MGSNSIDEWVCISKSIKSFCPASGLETDCNKSKLYYNLIDQNIVVALENLFGISAEHIDSGLKYPGFFLKPNDYRVSDWRWLVQKMEKKLGHWTGNWLSLGGRLTLLKSSL